jgi:hypothetical protein
MQNENKCHLGFVVLDQCHQQTVTHQIFCLGENLDGATLSFTTHPQSCQWERKDRSYKLHVDRTDPAQRMSERAVIVINLPYYNSTLFVCLTPAGSSEAIHQENRWVTDARV